MVENWAQGSCSHGNLPKQKKTNRACCTAKSCNDWVKCNQIEIGIPRKVGLSAHWGCEHTWKQTRNEWRPGLVSAPASPEFGLNCGLARRGRRELWNTGKRRRGSEEIHTYMHALQSADSEWTKDWEGDWSEGRDPSNNDSQGRFNNLLTAQSETHLQD
jgi:hypothetical protein